MNLSFAQRANHCLNPVARRLFRLMDEKQTNLSIALDVFYTEELIQLADQLGPFIAVLKTHIDILRDFSTSTILELKRLANHHRFIIFEDRKFADIGQTVKEQYRGGVYEIVQWADLINAHTLGGPSTIEGLKEVGLQWERALLLLAQMSSWDNLLDASYAEKTVKLALQHPDFVIGFIAQEKLTEAPHLIHMTPGIHLFATQDTLGQRYVTIEQAILEKKTDIIIVGRGITKSKDVKFEAAQYQKAAYAAYQKRLSN